MAYRYIVYKKGYKYQLMENFAIETPIKGYTLSDNFISLSEGGMLQIAEGYAWDGPSGPAVDTPNFMRGSLVHDAIYQLIGKGYLQYKEKKHADKLLKKICIEDGMFPLRAALVYLAVKVFGNPRPSKYRENLYAP